MVDIKCFLNPVGFMQISVSFYSCVISYFPLPSLLGVSISFIMGLIQFILILGITCFSARFLLLVLSTHCSSFKVEAPSSLSGVSFNIAINSIRHTGLSVLCLLSTSVLTSSFEDLSYCNIKRAAEKGT